MKKTLGVKVAFCVMFLFILFFSNKVLATNDGLTILRKNDTEYIIYLNANLDKEYEYAFTNNKGDNKESLDYIRAEKESAENKYVMYISGAKYDNYFKGNTAVYVYARDLDGNYLADGISIDLNDSIPYSAVDLANNVTKRIAVDTTQKTVTQKTENEIKYTQINGRVDITDDKDSKYSYYLVKLPSTDDYNRFMSLAEEINKLQANSGLYDNIRMCKEFYDLYNQLMPSENWAEVTDMKIEQPADSKTGEQYVLWIKNDTKNIVDVQFLTCFQDENKEFVKEENIVKTTSKLPITYDSVILFVILGVALVLLVMVIVAKKKNASKRSARRKK